jgi:hypothetical protein
MGGHILFKILDFGVYIFEASKEKRIGLFVV